MRGTSSRDPEWSNPCIPLQKRDLEVLWSLPFLLQSKMVIVRVAQKRGWFVMGQHPAILPPTPAFLHPSKTRDFRSKLQERVFCIFISAHHNTCGFPSIFSLKKKLVKSIINIKHQSILASFPENKLQKIISKKDVKALGRTDTGTSSDVVL